MQQTKKIIIDKKTYTVNFPNIGNLMDIEARKMALSNGTYGLLVASKTIEATKTLDLIDAISTFSVLIPELTKDLDVDNYTQIGVKIGLFITKAYTEQYYKWYSEIIEEINKAVEEATKELDNLKANE